MISRFAQSIRITLPAAIVALLMLAVFAAPRTSAAQGPYVRIISPCPEVIYPGPDITVQLEAGGLQIAPGCNSIHIALDNEPFAIKYDVNRAHILRNVMPGTHTLRVWLANHLNQAIDGSLQYVTFSVGYPNEENRPARGEPFLTLNLPQGRYLGIDGADVTLDFMVTGVPLSKNGYRVQYYVDGRRYVAYDCTVRQIRGLEPGLHRIRVELVDEANRPVFGPFASNERIISIAPEENPKRRARGERPPKQPVLQSIPGAMTAGQPTIALDEIEADREARNTNRRRESATQRGATDFKLRDDTIQAQKVDYVERTEADTAPVDVTEVTETTTPLRRRVTVTTDTITTETEMRTIRVTPRPTVDPAATPAPSEAETRGASSVPLNVIMTRDAAPVPAAPPAFAAPTTEATPFPVETPAREGTPAATPTASPTGTPTATPPVTPIEKKENDTSR